MRSEMCFSWWGVLPPCWVQSPHTLGVVVTLVISALRNGDTRDYVSGGRGREGMTAII